MKSRQKQHPRDKLRKDLDIIKHQIDITDSELLEINTNMYFCEGELNDVSETLHETNGILSELYTQLNIADLSVADDIMKGISLYGTQRDELKNEIRDIREELSRLLPQAGRLEGELYMLEAERDVILARMGNIAHGTKRLKIIQNSKNSRKLKKSRKKKK